MQKKPISFVANVQKPVREEMGVSKDLSTLMCKKHTEMTINFRSFVV